METSLFPEENFGRFRVLLVSFGELGETVGRVGVEVMEVCIGRKSILGPKGLNRKCALFLT